MAFFAIPYRVLLHDTMAYGSHHFLTNLKFQCEARERFLFEHIAEAGSGSRDLLHSLVPLTQEGYTRNLAPVHVGERVGILLSLEESTRCSVRMCFRVVREDGAPVCCGFQSVVLTAARTGEVIPAPEPLVRAMAPLRERLRAPAFRDRVLAGGAALESIFDTDTLRFATAAAHESASRIVPEIVRPAAPPGKEGRAPQGVVLTFPGQGAWDPRLLQDVLRLDATAGPTLLPADAIARRVLGHELLPLCSGPGPGADAALSRNPDLTQVASYLTSVLAARYLLTRGIEPYALLGHSFGEIAAMTIGGALDIEAGVEIACQRVKSLGDRRGPPGGMLAILCDEQQARELVDAGASLQVAVVNHAMQTVISGTREDLERLAAVLEKRQIKSVPLGSRYPFHCDLLREAADSFAAAIRNVPVRPLHTPVYSPLGRGLCEREPDLATILPAQLVQHLHFPDAVEDVYALGGRTFIECGGGRVLTDLVQRILRDRPGVTTRALAGDHSHPGDLVEVVRLHGDGVQPTAEVPHAAPCQETAAPSQATAERSATAIPVPIAIVSLGCVLPGAAGPEQLWENLLAGHSGIVDLSDLDATLAADFMCEPPARPDKTYTLLYGRVGEVDYTACAAYYSQTKWAELPVVGQFLATATAQCLARLQSPLPGHDRMVCLVGSTAEGSVDDERGLLLAGIQEYVAQASASAEAREAFAGALPQVAVAEPLRAAALSPRVAYSAVARRLLGEGVEVLAIDAACASALYSIDIAARMLRDGTCDAAFCGGAFAPGMTNSCLFAQFQGLSPTGSRPLDASADGAIFGEGAAVLLLKRLPDALTAGDQILGVVRGVATSSDGRSPSVMQPRQEGQVRAMRRALERYDILPETVQYIEAHATGTPVGDSVELAALEAVFGTRSPTLPPIRLASLKGLIGHTGWLAGAASIVALCMAFQRRTFPVQTGFSEPAPRGPPGDTAFAIESEPRPWPANRGGLPRRAGVNGFGFGGCDAHLVLEEFEPRYHTQLCQHLQSSPSAAPIAVVGYRLLLPAGGEAGGNGHVRAFAPAEIELPDWVVILPDVQDHMDRSQSLAVRVANDLLQTLSAEWQQLRSETGVIVGLMGRTRRGIDASQRVYLDRLERRLDEIRSQSSLEPSLYDQIRADLTAAIRRIPPSGPYTLPGAMPNVAAGRVANVFDLGGPNLVLDAEQLSLFSAIAEAERLLRFGDCRLILAGSIAACVGGDVERLADPRRPGRPAFGEGAILLALCTTKTAQSLRLPILAELSLSISPDQEPEQRFEAHESETLNLLGAHGAAALAAALASAGAGRSAAAEWTDTDGNARRRITVFPGEAARRAVARADDLAALPEDVSELLSAPMIWTAPRWVRDESAHSGAPWPLSGRSALILTDDPAWLAHYNVRTALRGCDYRVVCPSPAARPGDVGIDLTSTATMEQSLRQIGDIPHDAIILLRNLAGVDPLTVAGPRRPGGDLLDLLFAVARHDYERLETGALRLGVVCLSGVGPSESLHPWTGLTAGFLRALSRELPSAVCRQVNTSGDDLSAALETLAAELARDRAPADIEVCCAGEALLRSQLGEVPDVSWGEPLLGKDSVVLATGGARGVTAVLVETLARQFGCTVVLLGRVDPDTAPAELLELDDEALPGFEQEFYRRELALDPGARIPELRERYASQLSAREAALTIRGLRELPVTVRYMRVDVTCESAVDEAVRQVAAEFQRLDLVVHGAGIQSSALLSTKTLEQFRTIVATKVDALGNLLRAYERHLPNQRVHFHLVTSTFSHLGNAGQPDYGAANVAMDRLAESLPAASQGHFEGSSLGWLGWFNVGMTRGTAYARLGAQRRLSGITRERGADLFRTYLAGRPAAATLHVITAHELRYFGVELSRAAPPAEPAERSGVSEQELVLTCEAYPFLRDHRLDGVPTLPGAFALELVARAARTLRPDLSVVQLRGATLDRFVKLPDETPVTLRIQAEVIDDQRDSARIRLELVSDFVHASGLLLQANVVHAAAEVVLASERRPIPRTPMPPIRDGWRMTDPYLHPHGRLRLEGLFRSIAEVDVSTTHSATVIRLRPALSLRRLADALLPVVLLDASWRFSSTHRGEDGNAVICVPLKCGTIDLLPQHNDLALAGEDLHLTCAAPRQEGDTLTVDWVEVCDSSGRVIFAVRDMVGRVVGRVPIRAWPLSPAAPAPAAAAVAPPRPHRATNGAPRKFAGKIALVTGSGRGLGKVIAQQLAAAGATVVVNSFHSRQRGEQTTREILDAGGQAVHVWGSVAQPSHLDRIFEEIDARFGGLDFLISNASTGTIGSLKDIPLDHWGRTFQTNVVALHQAALRAAPLMRRRGGGRIVAISSVGSRLCFDEFGGNGPVKAALESLVRYLAFELGPDNIQVNSVSPGPISGEWLDQFSGRPRWETLVPRGQFCTEPEVAEAVLFLLSNSGMNAGQVLVDAAGSLCICDPALDSNHGP